MMDSKLKTVIKDRKDNTRNNRHSLNVLHIPFPLEKQMALQKDFLSRPLLVLTCNLFLEVLFSNSRSVGLDFS